MVGLFAYTIAGMNQREKIGVTLSSPMEVTKEYVVEFYASLADNHELAVDKLGLQLSGLVGTPTMVEATGFVSDTSAWVRIVDTIVPAYAYDYLTIGNFYDDASTNTQANPGGGTGPGCYGAYYFIDDVRVEEIGPATSTGHNFLAQSFSVYPNPSHDGTFKVRSPEQLDFSVEATNLLGKEVPIEVMKVQGKTTKIRLDAPAGVYLLAFSWSDGVIVKKVIVD